MATIGTAKANAILAFRTEINQTEIISDNINPNTPPLIRAIYNNVRETFLNLLKAGENLELTHQQAHHFTHRLASPAERTLTPFGPQMTALDWAILKKNIFSSLAY
jgi:hypothetical protein